MMHVTTLFILIGISSAQVNQYPQSVFYRLPTTPYSFCPDQGVRRQSCLKADEIPVPFATFYQKQPIYIRVVGDTAESRRVDNICTTMFKVPDDSDTYVNYDSTVYTDGSVEIVTSVTTQIGAGTYSKSTTSSTVTQRLVARDGDTFIGCESLVYGEESARGGVYTSTLASLPNLNINNIRNIINNNGLDGCGIYVLPYNRPTRCVTQQVCSLTNPLLRN